MSEGGCTVGKAALPPAAAVREQVSDYQRRCTALRGTMFGYKTAVWGGAVWQVTWMREREMKLWLWLCSTFRILTLGHSETEGWCGTHNNNII